MKWVEDDLIEIFYCCLGILRLISCDCYLMHGEVG